MSPELQQIFQDEYRVVRPRAPMPPLHVRFRRFTTLNTTIRLREGGLHVSLSDMLEGAPEAVLRAIAHILMGSCSESRMMHGTRDATVISRRASR